MSLNATNYALAQRFTSRSCKLVMIAIADCADDEGRNSFQAVDTLAHKSMCSPRTVQRVMRQLETAGHLRVRWGQGPRGTNVCEMVFQKLPAGFRHPWEENLEVAGGCHGDTPGVQEPTTSGDAPGDTVTPPTVHKPTTPGDGGGDIPGHVVTPKRSGTGKEKGGGPPSDPPAAAPRPDLGVSPILAELRRVFPNAPVSLSPTETRRLKRAESILAEWSAEDWLAARCWYEAPASVIGRSRWPRDRGELLLNASEATQIIRNWWKKRGRRWWEKRRNKLEREKAPPEPVAAMAAEPEATEEDLEFFRQRREGRATG